MYHKVQCNACVTHSGCVAVFFSMQWVVGQCGTCGVRIYLHMAGEGGCECTHNTFGMQQVGQCCFFWHAVSVWTFLSHGG